ncbi:MAG TPA: hypothetical protein VHH73_08275, partial [Verrucomicrobiae bacterium]|nr:hypothetical protein [Verrucomicrobiae bacterium]
MNVYRVCLTGSLAAGALLALTGCEVHEGYYHHRPATVYVQAPPPPAPVYVQAPPPPAPAPVYVPAPAPVPTPAPAPAPPPPDATVVASAPPPQIIVQQAPPAPIVEVRPIMPGPGYIWVGGYWEWRGRWVWSRGHWGYPPRRGVIWVGPR